jgi:hypothetical protein
MMRVGDEDEAEMMQVRDEDEAEMMQVGMKMKLK